MASFDDVSFNLTSTSGTVNFTFISHTKQLDYTFAEFTVPRVLSSAPAVSYFYISYTMTYTEPTLFVERPYNTINTLPQAFAIKKGNDNHLSIEFDLEHSQAGPNLGGVVPYIDTLPTTSPNVLTINLAHPQTRYDYEYDNITAYPSRVVMHITPTSNMPVMTVGFLSNEPSSVNPLATLEALAPVPAMVLGIDIGTYKLSFAFAIVLVMTLAVTLVRLLR